ncbi:MAG: peptidase M48 [Planctomycetota bacterium]|nr:MAG: peptidase M48 [Planctomycetota bacterium]
MSSEIFYYLFIAFFVVNLIWEVFLNILNLGYLKKIPEIPQLFKGKFEIDVYEKGKTYSRANLQFSNASSFYTSLVTLIILFSGFLPWLNKLIEEKIAGNLNQGVTFFIILFSIFTISGIPFNLYKTFNIEMKFGFNKMTFGLYIVDFIKHSLLAAVIGVPVLYAVLWFFSIAGTYWWVLVLVFVFSLQLIFMIAYPMWIAPLFNKYESLKEGELKTSLMKMALAAEFPLVDIFVMDGSKRSSHSNAYFTGFGKFRRIVLYDTLIEQMNTKELTAVLAHEIGHYKKGHIYKLISGSFLMIAINLWILSLFIDWSPLYQTFGFADKPVHVGIFLFFTCFSIFTFFLSPMMNIFSRKYEYEADAYSVEICGESQSMKDALIKLTEKNLSNLTPHPLYSFVYYSHPTVIERISAISKSENNN